MSIVRLACHALVAVLLLLGAPAPAKDGTSGPRAVLAPPTVRIISGNPLTIHVGSDLTFQVFNSAIPGQGQIYPTNSGPGTADMGWFVRVGSTLYAPDFNEHPAGSATGGLGSYTSFTNPSISAVSGTGTAADPFRVTVTGTAPGANLTLSQVVEYVNGNNYFTKRLTLTNGSASAATTRIFLGGDIYLANSDSGVPFREPVSNSVGGQECVATPNYTILFIPQSPADAYAGQGYSTVWQQIGAGQLSSTLATGCLDNGAALQWNRTIPAAGSVTIQAATSFGAIPPITQFNVSAVTPASGAQGATVPVTISGFGFQSGTTFAFGAGITVGNLVIVDGTTATATLTIAPAATPGPRDVIGTQAPAGLTATLVNGFTVTTAGGPAPPTSATPVPTLGSTTLVILCLVIVLAAVAVLRRI